MEKCYVDGCRFDAWSEVCKACHRHCLCSCTTEGCTGNKGCNRCLNCVECCACSITSGLSRTAERRPLGYCWSRLSKGTTKSGYPGRGGVTLSLRNGVLGWSGRGTVFCPVRATSELPFSLKAIKLVGKGSTHLNTEEKAIADSFWKMVTEGTVRAAGCMEEVGMLRQPGPSDAPVVLFDSPMPIREEYFLVVEKCAQPDVHVLCSLGSPSASGAARPEVGWRLVCHTESVVIVPSDLDLMDVEGRLQFNRTAMSRTGEAVVSFGLEVATIEGVVVVVTNDQLEATPGAYVVVDTALLRGMREAGLMSLVVGLSYGAVLVPARPSELPARLRAVPVIGEGVPARREGIPIASLFTRCCLRNSAQTLRRVLRSGAPDLGALLHGTSFNLEGVTMSIDEDVGIAVASNTGAT